MPMPKISNDQPKVTNTAPVLPCTCTSSAAATFQDATYGKGKRVHSVHGKPGKQQVAECSVCGRRRDL